MCNTHLQQFMAHIEKRTSTITLNFLEFWFALKESRVQKPEPEPHKSDPAPQH
jgi:hypothetical protein